MNGSITARQRRLLLIFGVIFMVVVALLVVYFTRDTGTNQFGARIKIQNYDNIVKNLSPDMRDSIENYTYTVAAMNHSGELKGSSVSDMVIRNSSSTQTFSEDTNTYDGNFIIDSKKLQQSYFVQYSYSKDETNTNTGSSPVIVSCLPKDKLIYGSFNCKDLISESTSEDDALLQYLPFQNFSFKITPVEVDGGALSLNVALYISDVDLGNSAASRFQAVASYKQQVYDWIKSKGVDPTKYTYKFNYDDAGNRI